MRDLAVNNRPDFPTALPRIPPAADKGRKRLSTLHYNLRRPGEQLCQQARLQKRWNMVKMDGFQEVVLHIPDL
jgi:hypothetical protein